VEVLDDGDGASAQPARARDPPTQLWPRYSPDTHRLRDFAVRNRLPHRFLDVEEDPGAESLLRHFGVGPSDTPVVIWRERMLRNPSTAKLAERIGLRTVSKPEAAVADLVVVGAGPAGLGAAVYGASEGLVTVVVDAVATGGQAATSSRIENYLGFPAGISGAELAERAVVQAKKFGARITVPGEGVTLRREDGHYRLRLADGADVLSRTVVIATGARYRKLPLARLEEFEETSVYYAATMMEAQQCVGNPVVVVGGGNSAGQAALFLANRAAGVRLVICGSALDQDMSRYLSDRISGDPRIEVLVHTEVRELLGDGVLTAVVLHDSVSAKRWTVEVSELFVFIGATPCTGWLADILALDSRGYVLTGAAAARAGNDAMFGELGREPLLLETSSAGAFAVGDVRSGSIKRVASAVGEGAMAVRLVHEHLAAAGRGIGEKQSPVAGRI
jgi:thioredoxin reductase (NADPH)